MAILQARDCNCEDYPCCGCGTVEVLTGQDAIDKYYEDQAAQDILDDDEDDGHDDYDDSMDGDFDTAMDQCATWIKTHCLSKNGIKNDSRRISHRHRL
jgi:hypothetical protein